MSKYLINSTLQTKINGYYVNQNNEFINGELLYKKESDNDYTLYYDDSSLTWNIANSGEIIYSAKQGNDRTDPYKANWGMNLIIIKICGICGCNSNLCDHEDFRPSKPKTANTEYLEQLLMTTANKSSSEDKKMTYVNNRCDGCGMYICCCNISENDNIIVNNSNTQSTTCVKVVAEEFRTIKSTENSGWMSVSQGSDTTWGDYRIEYNSLDNNRYGYIHFTMHKNTLSDEILLNILEQRQFYNEGLEVYLPKHKYLVFTDIRVATDFKNTSYVQVKYNQEAYNNSDIMAKIILNNNYHSQWNLLNFRQTGNSSFVSTNPSISMNVIEAKALNENKFVLDTDGHLGLNIETPKRTLDINGTIRTKSTNQYFAQSFSENDLMLHESSQEKFKSANSHQFGCNGYNRFEFLRNLYLDFGTNILSNSGSSSFLVLPNVELGDYLLFMYSGISQVTKFILKRVVNRDYVNQLVMDTVLEKPSWFTGSETKINLDTYLIKKDSMIIETLSVNSSDYKQIDGLYTKFTEKILDGDKLFVVCEDNIYTRQIQKVINDQHLVLTKEVSQQSTNQLPQILGLVVVPSQLTIQNSEGKSNILVDNKGALVFTSNKPSMPINAAELFIDNAFDKDFLKLNGNLKIDGEARIANNLIICNENSEEPVTAFIDSTNGDLKLKGSVVSNRIVASSGRMVQFTVDNLLSKTQSTWSDARLKKDIKTIEETEILNKIKQLNPVKFKWKENEAQDMGFIAQEVQSLFPDAVSENEDGILHIHYNRLLAYMVMGMKKLADN